MKKRILTLFIVAATFFTAQAQLLPTFDLGVKAGLNFTSLKSNGNYFDSDTKAGFLAGAWARVGVLGFHIQPELYYTTKNSSISRENNTEDVKFSTIDLPILLGTKFGLGPLGARVQVGPQFSFVLDKDNPSATFNTNFKDRASALVGGVGVDISKFSIDLRYEHGLGNINRNSDKQKLNLWTVGLGFNFL